jgi:hypothetical protein
MSGGDDRALAQGERDVLTVAQEYFRALYAPDHDRVREVASPAMTFADPTAEGQAVVITSAASREEFLSYLQANSVGSDAEAVVDPRPAARRGVAASVGAVGAGRVAAP